MAGIRRIRRGLTRGVLFALVLGSSIPLLAQERQPNEEKDKEARTAQERPGIEDRDKSVRLPLELEDGKTYTFAVTSLGGEPPRKFEERERAGDESSREDDSEASPQRRPGLGGDQGGAERLTYRFDAKKSAAASGETTVQVTVSEGSTLGLPGASTLPGASPQDRSIRPGAPAGMMTYTVTIGKDGELRPDAAGQHAMPEETKQHVALILGQGLHQKMLKAGETYGQEAFSGSKHHGSRGSASESTTTPPRSTTENRESAARDAAKSKHHGKLDGVAFVFRGTVEREGKELAFFDIVKSDGRSSPAPSSQSQLEKGEAAQAKDRSGGALRSGAFQGRSEDDCGAATYNLKDGLIEQLSLSHPSRGASASRPGLRSESEREEGAAGAIRSSKEDESALTLLIRRIDGGAEIPRTPERSTGSSDRDESD
jgi:hypothetical protein